MSCLFMLSFNSKTSPELLNHVMRTLLENITGIRHSCCFFLKGYELWTVVTLNINESVNTTHIYIIRICCCLVFIHVRTVSENKNKTYKSWRILFLFLWSCATKHTRVDVTFFSFYDHVPQNIQELTYPFSLFMIMCHKTYKSWRILFIFLWSCAFEDPWSTHYDIFVRTLLLGRWLHLQNVLK